MARIDSAISPTSEGFQTNRAGMLALLAELEQIEGRTRAASERARERFETRHQLLPRDRVALLLDPGRP
ncbi:MAG: acyl-CoA carboxylase subunit beta, partial [Pseudodonghicola sp.]